MKRFSITAILFSLISVSVFAFSEKDIISPAPGIWCNQQALVLSSQNACEIYYSITGSDPFESGFAYDGPVLIERKNDVRVRIGVVEADGSRKEFKIDYTVMPAVLSTLDNETREFAEKNLVKSPLITYRCGSELALPSGLKYSFENSRIPSLRQKLKLQSNNSVERFVSFFVTDGINNYHSVIRVMPAEKSGSMEVLKVPYAIRDWVNFTFTNKKFIYQLDDEMWNSDYSERHIDRAREHSLRWQSVDFSKNNRVYETVIPPLPDVTSRNFGPGTVAFTIDGDGNYTFENGEKIIFAEAFYGEENEGFFAPKVYLNGNLNGSIKVGYVLDKLPPSDPDFKASENSTFSRNAFALKINHSSDADVYYAVSEPVYYEEGKENQSGTEIQMPEEFSKYTGGDIVIRSHEKKSCAYKIYAYAVDRAGNSSRIVEQKYIIDELNFYLGGSTDSVNADGSFMNPFVSIEEALKAINSSEGGTRLHLKGDVIVNDGEYVISKDCVIHGNGGKIIFCGASSIAVDGASVTLDNCTLEKNEGANGSVLAKVNRGTVSLIDCEITGFYREGGKLFEVKDSAVILKDCGFTIQSNSIALCGDVSGGTFNASGCRFTVLGQSASALRFSNSACFFEDNIFTLIGSICKGVELTGGSVSFMGSIFTAQSDGKYKNSGAVFRKAGCKVTGLNSIRSEGF